MARFTLSQRADADIDEIAEHISRANVPAARRFLEQFWFDFQLLAANRGFGTRRYRTPKHLKGLQSWRVTGFPRYLIFFIPIKDGIDIIRVLHGARNLSRIIRET